MADGIDWLRTKARIENELAPSPVAPPGSLTEIDGDIQVTGPELCASNPVP
jgi:hypothetical protein